MKRTSDSPPVPHSAPNGGFSVGDVVEVGEFFWIGKENHITFDDDAQPSSGVGALAGGSVNTGCVLTVRGFETWRGQDMAVVRLDRKRQPRGAMAPSGQVFLIPISQIQGWPVTRIGE